MHLQSTLIKKSHGFEVMLHLWGSVKKKPQMVSTLRKELTFWGYYEGFDFFTHDFSEIINPKIVLMIDF